MKRKKMQGEKNDTKLKKIASSSKEHIQVHQTLRCLPPIRPVQYTSKPRFPIDPLQRSIYVHLHVHQPIVQDTCNYSLLFYGLVCNL